MRFIENYDSIILIILTALHNYLKKSDNYLHM